jgi:glycosyltransferase involved in cell wall biosynthesis
MNAVRFLGFRWDVMDIMNAADLVVFPTHCEGLPRVLLEAALLGKPVISTKVDGVPELVVDGETGILVNPGDRAGLAAAIIELLEHPERAEAMGRNGQERVQLKFTSQMMARGTEKVYDTVLNRHRPAVSEDSKLHRD